MFARVADCLQKSQKTALAVIVRHDNTVNAFKILSRVGVAFERFGVYFAYVEFEAVSADCRMKERFENVWSIPSGVAYNAYLILDEKITLIDTVKEPFRDELISRISSVIDPAKIHEDAVAGDILHCALENLPLLQFRDDLAPLRL